MSFTAITTYEKPSRLGPPLAYSTVAQVDVQRPDHLRVMTSGDGPATEFYYDGKRAYAFAPTENLLAQADAPPTIDATLEAAYQSAAIYFPFTDVIVANPYEDLTRDMRLAFFIGQSTVIGDTTTDVIAYANDIVFVQAWIGAQDKLPRMLRAVFRDDPTQSRHQVAFSDWKLASALSVDNFKPEHIDKARQIDGSGFRGGTASGGDGSWSARGENGGTASGGEGSWHGTGAEGGTAYGGEGSWHAQGEYGGSASGYHADGYGTTVYHPSTYGTTYYHPPTAVYASSGCYNCGYNNSVSPAAAAAP
eukprot:gene5751-5627_t